MDKSLKHGRRCGIKATKVISIITAVVVLFVAVAGVESASAMPYSLTISPVTFSFLYLIYSMRPKRLPTAVLRNHERERAVAISGLIPIRPKSTTNALSLTPRPDIEIGNIVNRMMSGKKIKNTIKEICSPNPSARM
jgi:hypothetical protein